jgi:hypothetical protein
LATATGSGLGETMGTMIWRGDVVIEYRVVAVDLRERSKEHGTMGES